MICNYFYCDDPESARQMFAAGIDTVLTNDYWRIVQVKAEFVRSKADGEPSNV